MAYFEFGNLERPWTSQQARLFNLLIPHLHIAAKCLTGSPAFEGERPALSARQMEVLKWIAAGKSSWEIGMIPRISECTVKIHMSKIRRKLNVHTRAHAAAKGISLGLISL